ncbi:hypothetical protein TSUD_249910 [Trifolium subterraneum]|nr:hypothetical protein TSUD_249910 [Trifolium subterraneum]
MTSSVMSIKLVGVISVVLHLELLLSSYGGAVAVKHVHVDCIENERHALLELKASLIMDDTSLLPTWDSQSYGCCAWEGIVCSNQTGHVERLDLNGHQFGPFQGEINASLMELQHLKYLNLSFNWFSNSNFRELFGSLENLRFLDLQDSFNGGVIPNDLARLSHLQYLDLSNNGLEGTIPHQLGNLSHLQYLELSWNDLVGTIPRQLGSLSNLQELKLAGSEGLKVYDQNNTDVGGEWLSNLTLLTHLDLSYIYNLNSSHVWLQMIAKLPKIQELTLSGCDLSDHYLLSMSPSLLNFSTSLAILDLLDNTLSSSKIFEWVFNATSILIDLDLRYNNFKGTIPYDFGNIRNHLEWLDLSRNELHGGTSLESLVTYIPDCWSHLKALEFLDLSDNSLFGEVPSSMGSLSKLKVLILRNNSLAGKLPISLKNCTNLVMLDLGDNRLSGPIPYWLGQQLQMLSLRRNQLYGSLPQSLCYLPKIQLLDLSENNLPGQLFKCLKNFFAMSQNVSSTITIDSHLVYRNEYGRISLGSFDLIALLMWKGEERRFKNNQLILRSIDLSSNQLNGVFPEEIGDLILLVSLNLSSNNLSGEITSKIGRLTSLEFLDLSRNFFSGPIPSSLAQIDRLSMLNLSDNNLSGRIPIGTQLQSFDASSYEGNNDLCGQPLDKKCPGDENVAHQKPETHEESSQEDKETIYLSVALGFITGFWGLWGSLFLSRNWRHKYVLFLNNIIDTMYVFILLNAIKFQAWLRGL